jgi:hypothetical protein
LADGRLIRIGGDDDAQYVPLIHTPGLVQYDVIVDDQPTSPNSKEQAWFTLTQMMPFLSKLQLPPNVMFEILKYSPLPTSFVADVKKAMQQAQANPPPPDPKVVESQSKVKVAQIEAQSDQFRAQSEASSERARALAHVAAAKASSDKVQGDSVGASADAFAATAAGVKSLADAQVAMQGPHFDALKMLMDALQQEHDRNQGMQQQGFENAMTMSQQGQDMQHAQEAHDADMQQSQQDLQQSQQNGNGAANTNG